MLEFISVLLLLFFYNLFCIDETLMLSSKKSGWSRKKKKKHKCTALMSQCQELPSTGENVFLSCSAFEYGGADAYSGRADNSVGIVAFRYPLKEVESYHAKPFRGAVVRLTRSSLCVYRPSDRVFYCELSWGDVREKRRHESVRCGGASHEFAFFTRSSILVLEVMDTPTADGIAASLRLLRVGNVTMTSGAQATTSSLRGCSPTIHVTRASTSKQFDAATKCEALERIRRREEEMREAIFYVPSYPMHARSLKCEGSGTRRERPSSSLSPALRAHLEQQPQQHENMRESECDCVPQQPPPTPPRRPAVVTVGDAGKVQQEAETASEMRNLLEFLEEEEKKTIRSLKLQEERVRALRLAEEAPVLQLCSHPAVGSSKRLLPSNSTVGDVAEPLKSAKNDAVSEGVHKSQVLPNGPYASFLCDAEKNTSKSCKLERQLSSAKVQTNLMSTDTMTQSATETRRSKQKTDDDVATPAMAGAQNKDDNKGAGEEMCVEKKTGHVESLQKADERRQISDALKSGNCEVEALRDDVNNERSTVPAAVVETKTGGAVMYGNWKELRQKETGKIYYRHVVTKEASWKPPPEVVELKKKREAEQKKREGLKEEMVPFKKGPLRVLGAWKEYSDPNTGRLYYVNTETKERTWKVEETTFAT